MKVYTYIPYIHTYLRIATAYAYLHTYIVTSVHTIIRTYVENVSCMYVRMYVATYYCVYISTVYLLDGDKSKVFIYSTTLLGILTCGTSLLLWWLYKECFSSKDKYDVEGTCVDVRNSYIHMCSL